MVSPDSPADMRGYRGGASRADETALYEPGAGDETKPTVAQDVEGDLGGGLAVARQSLAAGRQAQEHVQPGRQGDQGEAQRPRYLQLQREACNQQDSGLSDHRKPPLGQQGANP